MSRGYCDGKEVFNLVRDICERYNGHIGFPRVNLKKDPNEVRKDIAEVIDELRTTANKHLDKIGFQIKTGFDEVKFEDTYQQYYVLVHLEENEQIARMQKTYTESELELLRLICFYLIDERRDNGCTDTEIQLSNRHMDMSQSKKKMSSMEATKTVHKFIEDGYLVKRKTSSRNSKGSSRIGLGARLMIELEQWLLDETNVEKCTACNKPVLNPVVCQSRSCDAMFHQQCVGTKSRCSV